MRLWTAVLAAAAMFPAGARDVPRTKQVRVAESTAEAAGLGIGVGDHHIGGARRMRRGLGADRSRSIASAGANYRGKPRDSTRSLGMQK